MKWIRDPIHGYIKVPDFLLKIVDSEILQRLRYIKQLAFVNLIYPSANHTRFEHSLGTMHLAGIFSEILELEKEKYMIAGLLHDVGHGPFSHVSEEVSLLFGGEDHERRAKEILKENSHLIENFHWKEIYKEICEGDLIAGDFGADRLDYLNRDAYHTGNPFGISDAITLIRKSKYINNKLIILEKGVGVAETILLSRFYMRKYVYFHPTNLCASSMVQFAIIEEFEKGNIDLEEFIKLDDYAADNILKNNEIYRRVRERKLFKEIIAIPIENKINKEKFYEIFDFISSFVEKGKFSFDPIFYEPKKFRVKTKVIIEGFERDLEDVSEIIKVLDRYERDLIKLRVFVDKAYLKNDVKEKLRKLSDII